MRRFLSCLLLLLMCAAPAFAEEETPIHRHGSCTGKVALSFDDGPHPTYTEQILDILKEYGVKSTFFVVGENAREHPDLVRRIAEEGHEVGNHTDSHAFLRDLSLAAMCKEVTAASDTIEEITGRRPVLFRPPGGSYSDAKIRALSDMGYVSVLWSKDTRDWTRPSVQSIVDAALTDLKGGDIILFHDFNGPQSPTPDALRRIIGEIKNRGFEIVCVGEVLGF